MLILALDISSVGTGFSTLVDGHIDAYGIISPNKKLSLGAKLLYFEKEVKYLIKQYKPDYIIVEDIFCFNKVSFKCLAEFRGVAIKAIYEAYGKDPYSIMAVEARKIMGVGTKKEDAFIGITKLCNLKNFDFIRDNDIVDSFCLGLACYRMINNKDFYCKEKRKKKRKTRVK